ncbi:hypothetical protein G7046_g4433 [Stylonectria norvegica]|nr:hypothetical protein G7046_g4433 [Stylonectria norvegica]
MPPKKASPVDPEAPIGLTEGELRFIKAVFDNMTQKPDADWDLVAAALGLKDAKCAKERFRQMSVRHGWRDSSATATPRKAKGGAAAGDGSDQFKVAKKPRTPRKKVKKDVDAEEEDDVKPKKEPVDTEMDDRETTVEA